MHNWGSYCALQTLRVPKPVAAGPQGSGRHNNFPSRALAGLLILVFLLARGRPGGAGVPSSLHNLKVVKSNPSSALVPLDVSPSVPLLG